MSNEKSTTPTSKIPIIVISDPLDSTNFCIVPQFVYENPEEIQRRIIYAKQICDSYFLVELSDLQSLMTKKGEIIKIALPKLEIEISSPLALIDAFATYLRRSLDKRYMVLVKFLDIEGVSQ